MPEPDGFDRVAFHAMGTECQLIFRAASRRLAGEFQTAALAWVAEFEEKYSRFRPQSLISRINASAGGDWIETDAELASILKLCDYFHWRTGGAFDPSALPLARLWDFGADEPVVPSADQVAAALELTGWQKIERRAGAIRLPRPGMAIDLGGIGKEYAVDRVIEQSRERGIRDILVDFGRDLRVSGEPPEGGVWRVGLEHPLDPGRCWGGVAVQERAVATSGSYLRYVQAAGRSYTHILDPRAGWPVDNGCQSATVIAPTCTEAGILSTTALILGRDKGLHLLCETSHVEGCLWANGERYETRGLERYVI